MPLPLIEANSEYMRESRDELIWINPEIAGVVEQVAEQYEMTEGAHDGWENPRLSWKSLKEAAFTNFRSLMESNPASAFGQLLRAGVQTIANGWYKRYQSSWNQVATEYDSTRRQEFHAPLFGSAYPRKVKAGNPFRSQQIKGQDIEIINEKWGGMEEFDREWFDDDQTGQVRQRASNLGEVQGVWEDAYFSRRFIGDADATSFPEAIEASNWSGENKLGTAITTPFSVDMYDTAVGNRPAAYAQLSYEAFLFAYEAVHRAEDPLGVKMPVVANYLLHSSFDIVNAKALLTSQAFPAVGPAAGGGEQGLMKGAFMSNPVLGIMKPVMNIHLVRGAWAVGEAHKGFMFQRRDPMEIVQELPQAGQSFEREVYRFKARSRWEQDWVDPRFTFLGNDGSAALTT